MKIDTSESTSQQIGVREVDIEELGREIEETGEPPEMIADLGVVCVMKLVGTESLVLVNGCNDSRNLILTA